MSSNDKEPEIIIIDEDDEIIEDNPPDNKSQAVTEATKSSDANQTPTTQASENEQKPPESTDSKVNEEDVLKRVKIEPKDDVQPTIETKSIESTKAEEPKAIEQPKVTEQTAKAVETNENVPVAEKTDASSKTEEPEKNSLWISNLPPLLKAADLKKHFAGFGKITSARIFSTKNVTNPTCFGAITMENAACALAAQTKFNRSNFQGKIIIVETVTPAANIPPTRPSQPVSKPQTTTPAVSQEAKTSTTSSDPKPANNSDVSSKAAVVQVAKESSVTEKSEGKKPAEKETKVAQASKEPEKRSSPKATTKKDSDSQKVPIKAPETSKSSSRASDSKQSTRRDSYKSKGRIQTKQGSSRSSHRDSTISNSINARRSGNYPRSRNLKESRDDYRSARSGGRFADRGKGHQTVHLSSRRNFLESGFSRPIITTSSEALYNQQHEILRMRQDAERMQMQRQREAALEKQRKDMEVELEKAKIDREKLRLEHERDRLEMEKLKFALRQAREHGQTRESEFRAKQASGSVKYAPKSTNSNNRSRDYSSKEKRRSPPRAEAYRSNTSSQRRPSRSRSPHRMSSSVRERRPESYYGNPSHKSSSRSRPEEPPRSSSHRATNQTVQLVNYHPSSSSRSAAHVQQPAAVSGYSSLSSHSGAASNQHHSRIDQQTSKDALYEKRLNELYRGNDSSYGRPVDNYGSSSYGRTATTDSRYQSNALSGNYNRSSGSSYDQSYPQNYSSSTSTQQHSSWPASGSALPYDTQVSNWRNAPGLDYPNIAASSYATERQSDMYQRRF